MPSFRRRLTISAIGRFVVPQFAWHIHVGDLALAQRNELTSVQLVRQPAQLNDVQPKSRVPSSEAARSRVAKTCFQLVIAKVRWPLRAQVMVSVVDWFTNSTRLRRHFSRNSPQKPYIRSYSTMKTSPDDASPGNALRSTTGHASVSSAQSLFSTKTLTTPCPSRMVMTGK